MKILYIYGNKRTFFKIKSEFKKGKKENQIDKQYVYIPGRQ